MWKTHENFLLKQEMKLGKLKTLYIGGGTPSLWGLEGVEYFKEKLETNQLGLERNCEFTLEVNPGTWTEESIDAWKRLGVNRFSLGIQSLRQDYLKILDRVHSVSDVFKTLKYFNEIEANFSVDFMLGLPWSENKERKILDEINEILEFNPSHLSLYILTAKAGYPYRKELPEDDFLSEEYLSVADFLKSKGFGHYEVSNFSKPGFESHHNFQYWKNESVAALGPSAVGYIAERGIRYKWKSQSPSFELEELDSDAQTLEKLYMGLRLAEGIKLNEHFSDQDLLKLIPLFSNWHNLELAFLENNKLSLSSKGLIVLDGLMQQIFSCQK